MDMTAPDLVKTERIKLSRKWKMDLNVKLNLNFGIAEQTSLILHTQIFVDHAQRETKRSGLPGDNLREASMSGSMP